MKLLKGLLIAAGVGLLWKGNQAKSFLDQLEWTFNSVKVDFNKSLMSGFSQIYLTLNVSFSNNTDFSIDVAGLVCDVSYNGYPVGVINSATPFQVLPQTPTMLALPLVVQVTEASDIITQLINNLQDMMQTTQFNFKGQIQTSIGSFNFDETKVLS